MVLIPKRQHGDVNHILSLGAGGQGASGGGGSGHGGAGGVGGGSHGGGSSGGGGSCFVAGTLVWMADGSYKKIEAVEIGDKLVGRNSGHNKVNEFDHPLLGDRKLYSFNDSDPFVTAEHPFMTKDGWKSIDPAATADECGMKVKPLREGDYVLHGFAWTELIEIGEHDADPETQLYNFRLSGDQTYYADNYLVHNKPGDDGGSGSGSGSGGLTKSQVQEMIDKAGMGPTRYNAWTDVINTIREDTIDFGKTVSEAQQAGATEAFTSAGDTGRLYDPLVSQNAANAQGFQYLDPSQQQAMMDVMNDPNLTPVERNAALNDFQNMARASGISEIQGNASQILDDMTQRGTDIEATYRQMGDEGYDRLYGRAMTDQQRQIDQSNAAISQTFGGQNRELMRRGFNPAQIAQLATQNANQEALARVAGTNAAFGQSAATLRGAEDTRSSLYNTGTTQNMNVKFQGEDVARQMTQGAEQAMREGFGTAAEAGAQFGTQTENAQLTTGGNLGAQAAGTQQGAANIGQTGSLGVMNTLSNDYRTDNPPPSGGGGSGSSQMMGALVGAGIAAFSDRRLKENIVQIGEYVKGIGIYTYNYIGEAAEQIGMMADEVIQHFPDAVLTNKQGFQLVDYKKLARLAA